MIVALSGTPGTGKTSVTEVLEKKGYRVESVNQIALENNFVVGRDEKRETTIIDVDRVNEYVQQQYQTNDVVLIEGHAAHLLKDADTVILLRCHPTELTKRLASKGWNSKKIKENVEAETIDVILCEAVELHPNDHLFEIDTTTMTLQSVASAIMEILTGSFEPRTKYNIGSIDWSEEILHKQ